MTGIASPPLMGLSASVDSGSIDDNAMTLFPDSYGLWNLSEIESNASFVLSPQNSSTNWPNLDLNTEGRDISDTCDMELELSPRELHDLYESYFDQADHNCYMLEKDTFLTKMDHQPLGHELLGLKYIVLAYGASASSTYNHLQNKLYEVSRAYFEKVETWNPLFAIISLQCCTLLATFELQQLLFIRAWDRINRAMWMAELFELHQMDGENEPLRQRTSGLFMAQTTNPEELEERRRTFCICFGSNTNAQINHMEKITTLLPNEHNINDPKALHRRTLYEALNQPMARKLSRFEGFIITTALHVRSLRHANIACVGIKDEHLEYDFWMHHFYITESLSQLYCAQYLEPTLRNSIVLSGTLCMAVRIQATLLCLQHAAVVRGSEIKPAQSFASFGKSKCFMTAMKLMNTIKQMHIQGTLINPNPFVIWSIYVTAQFYVRELHGTRCKDTQTLTPTPPSSSGLLSGGISQSGDLVTNKKMKTNHFDDTIPVMIGDHALELIPTRFELLHNIELIVSILSTLSKSRPLAAAFAVQIYDELKGGKVTTNIIG
uniref:Isobutyryl-CoA dehydrogenase, mitochondrial n=1 Tax=Talaromyces marneffei PM1 TaxID=1077442 RepID=A0A093V338_TALMA